MSLDDQNPFTQPITADASAAESSTSAKLPFPPWIGKVAIAAGCLFLFMGFVKLVVYGDGGSGTVNLLVLGAFHIGIGLWWGYQRFLVESKNTLPSKPESERIEELRNTLHSLGAPNAAELAEREIRENDASLAKFVFLQQACQRVADNNNPNAWIEMFRANAQNEKSQSDCRELAEVIDELTDAGARCDQIVRLIRLVQLDTLNDVFCQIDEQGLVGENLASEDLVNGSSFDKANEVPPVAWQLQQIDGSGRTIRPMLGLSLDIESHGIETRSSSRR